jgi:hypothetical protein
MLSREQFFACRFTSPSGNQTAHIRAWHAREAARVFKDELARGDRREQGTIEVTSASRRTPLRETFDLGDTR